MVVLSISASQFLHAPLGYRCRFRWSKSSKGWWWPAARTLSLPVSQAFFFFFSPSLSLYRSCFLILFNRFFLYAHKLSNGVKVPKQYNLCLLNCERVNLGKKQRWKARVKKWVRARKKEPNKQHQNLKSLDCFQGFAYPPTNPEK